MNPYQQKVYSSKLHYTTFNEWKFVNIIEATSSLSGLTQFFIILNIGSYTHKIINSLKY